VDTEATSEDEDSTCSKESSDEENMAPSAPVDSAQAEDILSSGILKGMQCDYLLCTALSFLLSIF
jgi:hypothetical protein